MTLKVSFAVWNSHTSWNSTNLLTVVSLSPSAVSEPVVYSTCVQNLMTLALVIPEILLGAKKLKMAYLTLTTPLLRMICRPYPGTWHSLHAYRIWPIYRLQLLQRYVWYPPKVCDLSMPFSGIVCHLWASTCYDQPVYLIWSICLPPMKTWKAIQNMGWLGVLRSLEISLQY